MTRRERRKATQLMWRAHDLNWWGKDIVAFAVLLTAMKIVIKESPNGQEQEA